MEGQKPTDLLFVWPFNESPGGSLLRHKKGCFVMKRIFKRPKAFLPLKVYCHKRNDLLFFRGYLKGLKGNGNPGESLLP